MAETQRHLKNGADVNAKSQEGVLLLILAVREGDPEMVKTLLKSGTDPNVWPRNGSTALDIAKRKSQKPPA